MLRTSSLIGPVTSGFVPFASAAPADALVERERSDADVVDAIDDAASAEAADAVARAAAASLGDALPHAVATWAPASSARIRVVEGAVLAAIVGYFALGLLRTLAGL